MGIDDEPPDEPAAEAPKKPAAEPKKPAAEPKKPAAEAPKEPAAAAKKPAAAAKKPAAEASGAARLKVARVEAASGRPARAAIETGRVLESARARSP